MVVTSQQKEQHVTDLEELFTTIAKYRLKLNPEKCVFGVKAGKFLGFLLTKRGKEVNLEKCAHHSNEEPDLSEGGAAVDRVHDRSVQICIGRRR